MVWFFTHLQWVFGLNNSRYWSCCLIDKQKEKANLVFSIRFKTDIDNVDKKDLRKGALKSDEGLYDDNRTDISNIRYSNSYIGIWQVFLIRRMLCEINDGQYDVFENTKEYKELQSLIYAIYGDESRQLIPKIKKGKIRIDLSLADTLALKVGGEVETDSENKEVDFERISKKVDSLYKKLKAKGTPVYVLIDELELSVLNKKSRKQDIALIRDLILVINKMNENSKTKNYPIHFIASIREEVINDVQVAGTEINKCIEDFGISINWSYKGGDYKESPLLQMIEKKINASESAKDDEISDDVWGKYFSSTINDEECRKYILSYSWQKPRDIVRMLSLAQNEAESTDTVFDQEMFDRAQQKYSSKAWGEICEELALHYSKDELDCVKELFTGIELPFSISDLGIRIAELAEIRGDGSFNFLKERKKLVEFLNIMYRWGIIGNTGERMMFSFLGYDKIDLTSPMVIHKPLRNFFAVKSRNNEIFRENRNDQRL